MDHAYYDSYAGLLAAELLGLTALCDDEATFYVRRHVEIKPDTAGQHECGPSSGLAEAGCTLVPPRAALWRR